MKVRALTLWRPWPWAILDGSKRVENRPRRWDIKGIVLAIHAGRRWHQAGCDTIRQVHPMCPPSNNRHPSGSIEGAARVLDVLSSAEARARGWSWVNDDGWCYVLERVVRFRTPIPNIVGRQGLFKLDADTAAMVVVRWNGGQPQ